MTAAQNDRILGRLRDGQWHTNGELCLDWPTGKVLRLSGRIYDLRRRGYLIEVANGKALGRRHEPGLFYYRLVAPLARAAAAPEQREALRSLAAGDNPPPSAALSPQPLALGEQQCQGTT